MTADRFSITLATEKVLTATTQDPCGRHARSGRWLEAVKKWKRHFYNRHNNDYLSRYDAYALIDALSHRG